MLSFIAAQRTMVLLESLAYLGLARRSIYKVALAKFSIVTGLYVLVQVTCE